MDKLEKEIKEVLKEYHVNNIEDINEHKWFLIAEEMKLSEKFIEKFENYVDWDFISCYQNLSEEFIIKHQDKLTWKYIFSRQKLSEKFIREYCNKINLNHNYANLFYSKELKNKIKRYQLEWKKEKKLFNNKFKRLNLR